MPIFYPLASVLLDNDYYDWQVQQNQVSPIKIALFLYHRAYQMIESDCFGHKPISATAKH